ncbi:MAG TPA: FHA domain-containing protein [Gemmatimonadaceae bacterium]|jgi:predicted component of type VI protein secretion system
MSWLAFGTQTRELRDGELVIGSGADADWRVSTADLMPRHFMLTVHGLNVSIKACTPDVVVVVNDRQLPGTYYLLHDGDVVAAGQGRFIYSDDEPRTTDAVAGQSADDGYLVDDQRKSAHHLVNRSTTLGRDASNGIVLRDPRASRFHAEIRREAGGFALHTMGSAGTTLNGAAMRGPRLLRDGDRIEVAYGSYRFVREVPPDVSVEGAGLDLNDETATLPTVVVPRSTMESSVRAVQPPAPVLSWKVIVGILVVVIAGIVAWRFVGH